MSKRGDFPYLERQILKVLEEVPESRNSDVKLTIEIWMRYYSEHLVKGEKSGRYAVLLEELFHIPREDIIKRLRARIQNDQMKFLPTTLEVAKQRKISEEVWRKYMGQGDVYGRLERVI